MLIFLRIIYTATLISLSDGVEIQIMGQIWIGMK